MVFAAKLVCVGFMILLSELWIAVLYVASGKLVGLSAAVPLGELTVWCLFGTLGGLVMAAMQLTVSLFLRGYSACGRPVRAALSRKAHGAYLAVFAHGLRHELKRAAGADEERLCRFYNYLRSIFMRFHGDRFYDPLPLRQLKMQHEARAYTAWASPCIWMPKRLAKVTKVERCKTTLQKNATKKLGQRAFLRSFDTIRRKKGYIIIPHDLTNMKKRVIMPP